jgi:hypothetical protein
MDEYTVEQLNKIIEILFKIVYSLEKPEQIILDLDSTLLNTYGNQEGKAFNFHYQADGYHPLLCFDGLTGNLIKIKLRKGSAY